MRRLIALSFAALCACGEQDGLPAPSSPLVDVLAWRAAASAEDPFDAERTGSPCPLPGFHVEGPADVAVLEVDTDECDFVTVVQPLLAGVPRGFPVDVSVAHLVLTAPEPSTAVMAISVGSDVVWREERPIPSPSGVIVDSFAPPVDAPAGTPLYFHVRNHGSNAYFLQRIGPAD